MAATSEVIRDRCLEENSTTPEALFGATAGGRRGAFGGPDPRSASSPAQRSEESIFTILLVCTGNICRSALAERLGRAYLDEALGSRAGAVRLLSAGTRAVVGSAMHPDSALVLRALGGDPDGFVARQLTDTLVAGADLTLTMTRAHRREVLALAPRALPRTFTLREAADLVGSTDGDAVGSADVGESLQRLVRGLAAARAYRSAGGGDDVTDPIDQPVTVHEEVGEAIAEALLPVLRRIAELVQRGS